MTTQISEAVCTHCGAVDPGVGRAFDCKRCEARTVPITLLEGIAQGARQLYTELLGELRDAQEMAQIATTDDERADDAVVIAMLSSRLVEQARAVTYAERILAEAKEAQRNAA